MAEDHYYIYGALHSGRDTLFLSNDSLRDHIHHHDKETAGLYHKWIRSCQVTHERETAKDHAKNLKVREKQPLVFFLLKFFYSIRCQSLM